MDTLPLPTSPAGATYAFADPRMPTWVKIGFTRRPVHVRLHEARAWAPRLEVAALIPGNVERIVHQQLFLSGRAAGREVFHVDPDTALLLLVNAAYPQRFVAVHRQLLGPPVLIGEDDRRYDPPSGALLGYWTASAA